MSKPEDERADLFGRVCSSHALSPRKPDNPTWQPAKARLPASLRLSPIKHTIPLFLN